MKKKVRFFLKRSSKVEIQGKNPIIIPFRAITVFLLLILVVISGFLFLRSDLFQIKAVDLDSEVPECATEEGVKLATEAIGVSTIFYDAEVAKQKILGKFYCLENVELVKYYPSRLKVSISERKPVAVALQIVEEPTLASATQSASLIPASAATAAAFALDKTGILFKNLATTSALPKVVIAQTLEKPGKVQQAEILWLLRFLDIAEGFNLNFTEFTKTRNGSIVGITGEGFKVIMAKARNERKVASSLQAILKQAKIEGVKFSIVDLRFEKPVLK